MNSELLTNKLSLISHRAGIAGYVCLGTGLRASQFTLWKRENEDKDIFASEEGTLSMPPNT